MILNRRRFIGSFGQWLVAGGTGLLVACQSQTQPITVTSAPASGTTSSPAPTTQSALPVPSPGGPSPSAAVSPVARPAASPSPAAPSASPAAVVASASPSPARAPVAGGAPAKPMYQMDPQHTGRSPFTGPRRLVLARTFQTDQPEFHPSDALFPGTDLQSSTAIGGDGTIYATTHPGWLFALKDSPSAPDKLDLAWRFRPPNGSPFHCTPAVARDGATVYVSFATGTGPAAKATLYALRAPTSGQDGQVVWQADLGAGQSGPPWGTSPTVGPDGTIYSVNAVGVLSAVDSVDGRVKWTAQAGTQDTAQFGQTLKIAPALGQDGTVYTTALTGSLYAVSPPSGSATEGTLKWSFDFGEHLGPTPLVSAPVTGGPNRGQDAIGSAASATVGPDGSIYVGANNSNFYAIDPDGKQKWLFEAERELAGIWTTAALSADASTLYFGANKGGMYALNTRDGSLKWQLPIVGSIFSSPALDAAGTLYTGSTVGHVFAINAADGQTVFDYYAAALVWAAPSIRADGTLVTADRNGRVMVFSS